MESAPYPLFYDQDKNNLSIRSSPFKTLSSFPSLFLFLHLQLLLQSSLYFIVLSFILVITLASNDSEKEAGVKILLI